MGFFSNLFGRKDKETFLTDSELVDLGVCPNCWGKQEYEGDYKTFINDQTKANINKGRSGKKAFVAQWVETYVTGIKLQNDTQNKSCLVCKGSFGN